MIRYNLFFFIQKSKKYTLYKYILHNAKVIQSKPYFLVKIQSLHL
jgi:hypothetical protein